MSHPVGNSVSRNPRRFANNGKLRAWQQAALDKFLAKKPQDFMAVATPGAGKTTFALRIATELMEDRTVERVIVVVPTEQTCHTGRQADEFLAQCFSFC